MTKETSPNSTSTSASTSTKKKKQTKKFSFFGVTLITFVLILVAIGFQVSPDVKWVVCEIGAAGYFDWAFSVKYYSMKCVAEASHEMLLRDFPVASVTKVRSKVPMIHYSPNMTWDDVKRGTNNYLTPLVVKGMLKDNLCTKWTRDYIKSTSKELKGFLTPLQIGNFNERKAFGLPNDKILKLSVNETFDRLDKGEPLFISFDNDFLGKENPVLLNELGLENTFPGQKFDLHTLFISNFEDNVFATSYHAAAINNYFYQCAGKKHWYFYDPKYLKYTSSFLSRRVMWTVDDFDKYSQDIFERLPGMDVILEVGDMMYVPPYWLHAVATLKGHSISIANRFAFSALERYTVPMKTSPFFSAINYIHYPYFVGSYFYGRFFNVNNGRTIFDWAVPKQFLRKDEYAGYKVMHMFEEK